MSDSDSDYIVEEYIKPDVVKHTYNNNDDYLSNSENSDNQEDISENVEEFVDDKPDLSQCADEAEIEDGENKSNRTSSRNILHVSNLEFTTQKEDLYQVFIEAGDLKGIRIPKGRKGFAFVEMKTEEGLKRALALSGTEINGNKILVNEGMKNKKHGSSKKFNRKNQNSKKPANKKIFNKK